jgi:uncharacterized repeat protein (TIGR02543 family)
MSEDLLNVAKIRSAEVSVYFSHTRPSGTSCFTAAESISGISMLAENIASGYRTAEDVMNGWMNSPGHKANIYNAALTEIGVGCFVEQSGYTHWVQFFANRASPAVASQPANVTETFTIQMNTDYVSKVTFDPRGGECSVTSVIREYGAGVGELPIPVREGYTFVAWYNEADNGIVSESTLVTGDMTLYAAWEELKSNAVNNKNENAKKEESPNQRVNDDAVVNTFKVKFNVNKGKALSKSKRFKLVKKGKAVGKLVKAKRPGYKFKGWFTKKKGGKKVTAKFIVRKNMTIYAHWDKK